MKPSRWVAAIALLAASAAVRAAFSAPQAADERRRRWEERSRQAEQALAEPYRGITARDAPATRGLFGIRSTGVSTAPVRAAAEAFLASLTPEQRGRTRFAVDDDEWRKWMNQHFYVRQGVSFAEMNDGQREKALGLLRASLSARGLQLSRDIMRLNHTLGELNGDDFEQYGEWLYWITVMGEPSADEPWGWQLDGHHLIVNYFVLGDQVVMTPSFFGSEPAVAASGKHQGTAVLQEERALGLAMVRGLDDEQRRKAVLRVSKTGNDNVAEAFQDNLALDCVGIRAADLTPAQRQRLLRLVDRFVGNMDDGHAAVKMAEVERHLDETWFAWIGGTDESSVFYYRVFSPVVLIEFDHQLPANLRRQGEPRVPNRDHVHSVIRTPNGNDYGKDLLRQHYERHPHPHGH